jgi:hypothetical protein
MGGYEDRQVVGYQNMAELIELISPFIYQVRKSEVLTELPPKVYQTREVQLTDEQKRLYKDIAKRDKTVSGDQGITVKTVLERMLRLQEIAGGIITFERNPDLYDAAKFTHNRIAGKNPKVEELLAIAEENDASTIVWCRFIEEIRMVCEALRERYGRDAVVEIHGGSAVALQEVPLEKVSRYGILGGEEISPGLIRARQFVEKPKPEAAPSRLAVSARYVLSPSIFAHLEKTPKGKGWELQLTDAMASLMKEEALHGLRYDGQRHDIGNKLDFIKANLYFGLQRADIGPALQEYVQQLAR